MTSSGRYYRNPSLPLTDEAIHKLHPANRGLDTGFYDYEN